MTLLSLIIPVYNGEPFLGGTLARVDEWMRTCGENAELIVVNDGSTDGTAEILRDMEGRISRYRHIEVAKNKGKGAALKAGFSAASGKYVAFTDADLPYGLAVLNGMMKLMEQDQSISMLYGSRSHEASRAKKGYGGLRSIGRAFFSWLACWWLFPGVRDSQCGVKMLNRRLADSSVKLSRVSRFAFDMELFAIARANGAVCKDFPVELTHRKESSVRLVADTIRMLCDMIKIRWNLSRRVYGGQIKEKPSARLMSAVLLLVSAIFGFYLAEGALTALSAFQSSKEEAGRREADASYDPRSKWEVVKDFRKNGIEAYPLSPTLGLVGPPGQSGRLFPLGNISRKKMVVCRATGSYFIFESDERGFNNPVGSHSKTKIDAVTIGDSFTEGECELAGSDVASNLRGNGANAVNLGHGGNGPLLSLATLVEYAEPLKPRVVFWLYYEGNDWTDLAEEMRYAELRQYLQPGYRQDLIGKQPAIDAALIEYAESAIIAEKIKQSDRFRSLKDFFKLARLRVLVKKASAIARSKNASSGSDMAVETQRAEELKEVWKAANARVSAWGGKLVIVYLPAINRYIMNVPEEEFGHRGLVLSAANDLKLKVIDFHKILSKPGLNLADFLSEYPKPVEAHYTAAGYKLLADSLRPILEAKAK